MRQNITRVLRDDSDWHPQVQHEVHKVAGLDQELVRSRVFVTSASTMHSLLNVLRYGEGNPLVSRNGTVVDLNYLSHLVIRCYERRKGAISKSPDGKGNFRVEIQLSPGVQVFKEGKQVRWPDGSDLQETGCSVAPLEQLGDHQLEDVEKYLTSLIQSSTDNGDTHQEGTDESH